MLTLSKQDDVVCIHYLKVSATFVKAITMFKSSPYWLNPVGLFIVTIRELKEHLDHFPRALIHGRYVLRKL